MSQLNPPPIRDSVDQDSRLGLRASWHAWFSQLFKWLQTLAANNSGINTGDQTNITGTAANLSGTPALPNGTTATTQANGDSSTKLANDAFVQAALTYYNTAVVWDGVNDRVLGIGQHTSDSFTAATSMPLHIACGDGQEYEIEIVGSYTAAATGTDSLLQPNNAVPTTNSFTVEASFAATSTESAYNTTTTSGGFFLGNGGGSLSMAKVTLFTGPSRKASISTYKVVTTVAIYAGVTTVDWNDTTTPYTSVGTIIMPNAWTGQIVCRRVA